MKKKCLMAAVSLLTSSAVNAQTQKDFIRNYKPPDFKFRSLTASLNSVSRAGIANNMIDTLSSAGTNGSGGLSYYEIRNSSKYQGVLSLIFSGSSSIGHVDKIRFGSTNLIGSGDYTRRFYLKDKFYLRSSVGMNFNASHSSSEIDLIADNISIQYYRNFRIGTGIGRVEYSSFARKAMDVEFLLKKGNRLNSDLTVSQLTEIADNLAGIRYKRGFDNRLLRIWRLEQIDSIIGGLDIFSKRDIRYMAFLSDAMGYSQALNRLSGSRIEVGVASEMSGQRINAPTIGNSYTNQNNVYVQFSSYIRHHIPFNTTFLLGFRQRKSLVFRRFLILKEDYLVGINLDGIRIQEPHF